MAFVLEQAARSDRTPSRGICFDCDSERKACRQPLARQGIKQYRTLTARRDGLGLLQLDEPDCWGLALSRSRCAVQSIWRPTTKRRDSTRAQGASRSLRSLQSCPNTAHYDANYVSENSEFNLPKAKACWICTRYVDSNGDGWREKPDGSPLILEVATQPDQTSRQLDELMRKDIADLGIKVEFKPAKVARKFEEHSSRKK